MRLEHTDVNGDKHDVAIGYQFGHGPNTYEVTLCEKPHKPSSTGKVYCKVVETDESVIGYYASIYDMEWVEREDRGWLSPEMELETVINAYNDIFSIDLESFCHSDADVIEVVSATTIASFPNDRREDMMMMKKWLDKQ